MRGSYIIAAKQYTDAGVEQFLLAFQDPLDTKAIEMFMDAVGI